MPLYHYPRWLGEVNSYLARLTNRILSAEDLDFPWIEAFLKNHEPEQAANETLEADGFIIENQISLPATLEASFRRECFTSRGAFAGQGVNSTKLLEVDQHLKEF